LCIRVRYLTGNLYRKESIMPRKPRHFIPNIPCHVISRGNNRNVCFFADDDYLFYLECLSDACLKHQVSVHAYVLMTNHVHLLMTISNESGQLQGRFNFDVWGKPVSTNNTPSNAITTRGFTGHEMLEDHGLIHMNGRVYDPTIGRFLSADIVIQAPTHSQNYNRYGYVFNNSLSLVDPSSYLTKEEQETIRENEIALGLEKLNNDYYKNNKHGTVIYLDINGYKISVSETDVVQGKTTISVDGDFGISPRGIVDAPIYVNALRDPSNIYIFDNKEN
ncbi:MAG: transposase, partial [Colwellia sp.]